MTIAALLPLMTACAASRGKPQTDRELKTQGFILEYDLAPGASQKEGVDARTDRGIEIFGPSILNKKNGGESSFGGTVSFPRWVRVTWRKDTTPGERWTTGTVVGDYTVEVLSRIPQAAFELAASR